MILDLQIGAEGGAGGFRIVAVLGEEFKNEVLDLFKLEFLNRQLL